MYIPEFDPKKTALIVIDMQNDFVKPGAPIFSQQAYDMCDKLNELLDFCRANGTMVIYSQNMCRADLKDIGKAGEFCESLKEGKSNVEGTEGVEIFEKVAPKEGDIVIKKNRYSFFFGTPLESILRTCGIETVIITGVCTDCCCFSTARDAGFRNFNVAFLSDCTGTVGYDDIGFGAFSAEQVQACYLTTIALTTGDVMTADECMRRFIK